ncbi:hypothetical protein [Armatimonas rosea]|uniref:Uncharacterized protein n=1 Tax=Armatimonas rosea TaxID=685828 RepID=A0A7W9W4U3_ARMRO|nr:hypothetical protein [Armatimonas rosea]MBB6048903.1 hypothetical protein [Armatimonas rosea]
MHSHHTYLPLLAQARRDTTAWAPLAYAPATDDQGEWYDANQKARVALLYCLQFDRQPSDEALVRFLFTQETQSRLSDPFQGLTASLKQAAYLLATYQRLHDLPLFCEAKCANFDTYCGFDSEYLCRFGEEGAQFFQAHGTEEMQELLEERDVFSQEHLANWWEDKQQEFPAQESALDILEWYELAVALDDLPTARTCLDTWEKSLPLPHSKNTLGALANYRAEVGHSLEAYTAQRAQLALLEQGTPAGWEWNFCLHKTGQRALEARLYPEALELLGRAAPSEQTAELLFRLALGPSPQALTAFNAAHTLLESGVGAHLATLEKAERAAQQLASSLHAHYQQAVAQERARIAQELSGL